MLNDLFIPEDWERINEEFRSQLSIPAGQNVKFYKGLGHALYEIAMGTSQFYSHKRSVGFVQGNSPYYDFLMPSYLRDAYQIQKIDPSALNEHHANWTEWVNTLKKDTVLVVATEDHPVTGELLNLDELDQALNDKKIFFIRISHSAHLYRPLINNPYTVRIASLGANICYARMGAKYKVPPVMAHMMSWTKKEISQALKIRDGKKEHQHEIQKFEQNLKEYCYPWASVDRIYDRIYDRSLLIFPKVTGDLLTKTVAKNLGLSLTADLNLWTTHLCYWNSIKMFKSWWKSPPTEDQLRDLIILSPEIIQRNGFADILKNTYQDLLQQQGWTF